MIKTHWIYNNSKKKLKIWTKIWNKYLKNTCFNNKKMKKTFKFRKIRQPLWSPCCRIVKNPRPNRTMNLTLKYQSKILKITPKMHTKNTLTNSNLSTRIILCNNNSYKIINICSIIRNQRNLNIPSLQIFKVPYFRR